jgi:hypothetical protein
MHLSRRIPGLHEISGRPRDGSRATLAERLREAHYGPANKWIAFSQRFAAITGPGRSCGRRRLRNSAVCRERCGSSWGRRRPGAAQDLAIPYRSVRRDGKSLGETARQEIGPRNWQDQNPRGADRHAADQ